MASETAPLPKKQRAKRRDFRRINASAINYAKASLAILATIVDDQNSPTLNANLEGQRTAFIRMLAELGDE